MPPKTFCSSAQGARLLLLLLLLLPILHSEACAAADRSQGEACAKAASRGVGRKGEA